MEKDSTNIGFEHSKWSSIKGLLDDDSPVVQEGVEKFLRVCPNEGRAFLLNLTKGENQYLAKCASSLIEKLGWIDGAGDFIRFIQSQRYELETGWFLLDRVIYPDFEASTYSLFLDKLSDRCRELLLKPCSPKSTCEVINRVLFHEYGFRGARENFENPENSFLHRVLDRREGLPIALCGIYILIARRIGFELDPIGTPGRFTVGCFAEEFPFYVDCWSGGHLLDLEDMEDKLGILPDEESGTALLPVTVSDTLARVCRNLCNHYSKSNQTQYSQLFHSFLKEFESVHHKATNA